ncbi:MAG: hypothetical protein RSB77_06845 [Bacilli bacterium]
MINKDPSQDIIDRKKKRSRNNYYDIWVLVFVIAYLMFCKTNFNTFNPFNSTWAYFRLATNDLTSLNLNDDTVIMKPSYRESYIPVLKSDLEKSDFKIKDLQTHLIVAEKSGLKRTYILKVKNLFGVKYVLSVRTEEIN